jgi:hypothetical protein
VPKRKPFDFHAALKRLADLIPNGHLAMASGPEMFLAAIEANLKAKAPAQGPGGDEETDLERALQAVMAAGLQDAEHIIRGHLYPGPMDGEVEAQAPAALSQETPEKRKEGASTVLAVLWEWGPGTKHEGARFWGCHGKEKDGRYSEWPKMGLRALGVSMVTVTEGEGLDLIPTPASGEPPETQAPGGAA